MPTQFFDGGGRTTFAFDPLARVTLKRLANGTKTSMTYDPAGHVAAIFHRKSDNSLISSYQYTYDKQGNRLTAIEGNGDSLAWGYDPTDQLLSERRTGANAYATTYTYDQVGNRIKSQDASGVTLYGFDAADRMLTRRTATLNTTYLYDADGNQTLAHIGGQRSSFTWDFENRNRQVTLPTAELVTFSYDGDLKRTGRIDSLGIGAQYLWDGENLLNEADELGHTRAASTFQPNTYGSLISAVRGGAADTTTTGGRAMDTWDELERAVRMWPQRVRRTATDADLDAFEAARGVRLPESWREFARTFGRCQMFGGTLTYMFAVPGFDDGVEDSPLDLASFDAMMHEAAREDAGEFGNEVYFNNAEVGPRLVFFASDDLGNASFGFDPAEVTDPTTGEYAIYARDHGYERVASSMPEFVMEYCFGEGLRAWRAWAVAGGEAELDGGGDRDPRIQLVPS